MAIKVERNTRANAVEAEKARICEKFTLSL